LSEQSRQVSIATIAPATFAAQVNIEEAAVKSYYDARPREFEIPEQARFEYVVLSLDNLASQTDVPAAEVRQAYEQNAARFVIPEERDASHILITAPADASAETKAAAKARAEGLLKQIREKPDRFAALARENSQDPGSAQNGGDLGFLVRGATSKAFDEALFALKPGEVAGPVETEFGYHIIRLNSARGGTSKPFEEAKGAIETELKRTRASKRFAELAEQLNNLAYEQSDSLKPAADALKVSIQQSPWIVRKPVSGSPLGGERFLKAAFSEDVLKNKRNSEVVDVAPGTLIAARLLEHKPAAVRPFEEVKAEIRNRLIEEEARKRALAEGRERLEKLRKGEGAGVTWSKPVAVTRLQSDGLSEPVMREVFRTDVSKLPAFAGTEDASGFQLIQINAVADVREVNLEARNAAAEQLKRLIAQEQLSDYVNALKRRVDVKIKSEAIEKK
jgi:peptidyl-prolyl cis-trans isomerase D